MTDGSTRVRFLNAPVQLMRRAQQHQQELMREFMLIHLSDDREKRVVPAKLLELVERQREEFADLSIRFLEDPAAVVERGGGHIDMEIDVPPRAAPAALELLETLSEADDYCRQGLLLTLAQPPEIVALREWFLGEIVRQVGGGQPTPWNDEQVAR